jgi:serine/threonine-protein kinase
LTPAYCAPEQILGGPQGIQVDVYSLGVILYEMIARRLPFDLLNQTPGQIERLIVEQEPKPPSYFGKLQNTASRRMANLAWSELDTLCLTAMHKDQKQRYQSVEALMRDLDHYLEREPLEARPDSFGYRMSKFVRRNRRVLSWVTVTTMVLAAIAVYSVLRIAKARRDTAAEVVRTQQIQRFMLNLFNAGDAETGPSEDLRVTTLLDRGARQAQMLEQDPETAAQLSQTLAGIYANLGKADRADSLLQSAFDKRMKVFGTNSPKVAETMTEIGLLRLEQGRPDEAERFTREALATDERSLPPGDPSTAKAKYAVGRVFDERGRYSEAIPLLQQAVELLQGRPELAADLAQSTAALADANYYTGNYPVAETLNRQALAIHEKLYGTIHPRVADDLTNLGEIQHDLGHDKEAEELYRQALQLKSTWYGERHPETAFCMMAVGQSLVYQKRFDEAAPLIQKSLEIQEEFYGKFHPKVAMALNIAGVLEQRRGHYDAAERDFLRMADINKSVYGDRHYLVGISILNLGQVYFDEKRYALAEQSFKGALDRFVEKLPAGHPSIAIAQQKLGAVLVLEGRYKEAEAPLRAAIESFSKQKQSPAERLANARKDLASVYQHLHESDKTAASIPAPPHGR